MTAEYVDTMIDVAIAELDATRRLVDQAHSDIGVAAGSDPAQLPRIVALQRMFDRFIAECEEFRDGPFIDEGNDDVAACMDIAERI